MKTKKEIKKDNKKKRNKIKEMFSRMLVGGASVATVVVVTATAFAVGDFKIETFSNAIYFETFIEPTDFELPEEADLSDPETEIVYEEVDLRMRLSSQFGDVYLPLDLFHNQGKFTDLAPNTNYELTAQHYNGFQWVNLKSTQVRTKLENKASILEINESTNYTESKRDLAFTIVTEAENPEQTNIYLEVQGLEVYKISLEMGENTYLLENIDVTTTLSIKIIYDILEEGILSTITVYDETYKMSPYVSRTLSFEFIQGVIHPKFEVESSDGLSFYAIIDRLNGSEIIEDINNLQMLYTSQLRRLRIYGKDIETQTDYLIDTINLTIFRPFNFVATIIDDNLTLTIIDPDERIKHIIWIEEDQRFILEPIGVNDGVHVYEVNIKDISSYRLLVVLNFEFEIEYEIMVKGETS
jgi:hypothetical protein